MLLRESKEYWKTLLSNVSQVKKNRVYQTTTYCTHTPLSSTRGRDSRRACGLLVFFLLETRAGKVSKAGRLLIRADLSPDEGSSPWKLISSF